MKAVRYRIGRSLYGTKWHLLRDNEKPICGYTSFNWSIGQREFKEVSKEELRKHPLCSNCRKKLRKF